MAGFPQARSCFVLLVPTMAWMKLQSVCDFTSAHRRGRLTETGRTNFQVKSSTLPTTLHHQPSTPYNNRLHRAIFLD